MSFHDLFGHHVPDPDANRWERGNFVSRCRVCARAMEKLPGLGWRLSRGRG